MNTKRQFQNFARCTSLVQLDEILAGTVAELHSGKEKEKQLIAELKALRGDNAQIEDYLTDVGNYTQEWLKTVAKPDARKKLVQRANEHFLKKHDEPTYKVVAQKRELAELIEDAKKYVAKPDFDRNNWRTKTMRSNLEEAYVATGDLPDDEERVLMRTQLRELIAACMPVPKAEQQANKKKIEHDIANIAQQTAFEVMSKMGFTKDGKKPETIDMQVEQQSTGSSGDPLATGVKIE